MSDNENLGIESSAVRTHIEMMQDVITRMAENSRSCKLWCVTLVAAVLVLVARTGEPRHALIALIPTLLFLFLDSYYLALERAFRKSYDTFVCKLHQGKLAPSDVYEVRRERMGWRLGIRCVRSPSIWPFYILLIATILVAWICVL